MIAFSVGGVTAYIVNFAIGLMTSVVAAGSSNDLGMAYDPVGDRFLASDLNGKLIQLDPTSFVRTDLPAITGSHSCFAFTP
jgi:hypothetical protein